MKIIKGNRIDKLSYISKHIIDHVNFITRIPLNITLLFKPRDVTCCYDYYEPVFTFNDDTDILLEDVREETLETIL